MRVRLRGQIADPLGVDQVPQRLGGPAQFGGDSAEQLVGARPADRVVELLGGGVPGRHAASAAWNRPCR
ncbi:hypothetical protein JOF41_002213 [Saccharothrix coeruleofusca]|uniref:hypothetical protein n=1 Tax=Saccharothrix coeruleofusca TaxID=33919 RepID=UPI001AE16EA9|nr:hypothetical protein [Saccharothrix coeruleofusca]MBP2336035.1 hypothetical protein [Saccharothrix coeruleofusca]